MSAENGTPLQFVFWETIPADRSGYTNTIEFYDLLPRYLFGEQPADKSSLAREFEFAGTPYRVVVTPAQFQNPDGTETIAFPGEREQIVEDVIRRLSVEQDRLRLNPTSQRVEFAFTIYELQKELRRVNHSLSRAEIKQALQILNRSFFEVTKQGTKKPMVSSTAFPTLSVMDTADEGSKRVLTFNDLVAEGLKRLHFRPIDYERLMAIKTGPGRWLYKRMVQRFTQAGGFLSYDILASSIARDSGMSERSRWRDTLKKVDRAVQSLADAGIVDSFNREERRDEKTRKILDVYYTIYPDREFCRDQKWANSMSNEAQTEFARISGQAEAEKFVIVPFDEVRKLRSQKRAGRQVSPNNSSLPLFRKG
jgi:hypothetical protein